MAMRSALEDVACSRACGGALSINRLFHFYWRFSRGLTLGVRAVVLDGEGRVFLIKHTYTDGWHCRAAGSRPARR